MAVDTLAVVITANIEQAGAADTWSTTDYGGAAPTYSSGNSVVTFNQAGTWAGVRTNIGKRAGKWYVEIEVTANGATDAGRAVGIASTDSTIDVRPGGALLSGAMFGDEKVRWNGIETTATQTGPSTTCMIGLAIDLESRSVWLWSDSSSAWVGGGNPELGTLPTFDDLPVGDEWFPCVWSNGVAGFRIKDSVSTVWDTIPSFRQGWYAISFEQEIHRFSNSGYRPSIAGVRTYFKPRLRGEPTVEQSVGSAVHGNRKTNISYGELILANHDGALDLFLTSSGWRDAKVEMYEGYLNTEWASMVKTATAYIESSPRATSEREVRIVLRDRRALLDRPANPNGYPLVIGSPLSCPIVALESGTYLYASSEFEFATITKVRDMGVDLAFGTAWTYLIDPIAFGIDLVAAPAGRVVCDMEGSVIIDAEIVTAVNGGAFTAWTAGAPDGWTTTETGGDAVTETVADTARLHTGGGPTFGEIKKTGVLSLTQETLVRIDVVTYVAGILYVGNSTGSVMSLAEAGRNQTRTNFASNADFRIYTTGAADNITIDNVRVNSIRRTDSLANAIEFLAGLAGLTAADLDATSIADTAASITGSIGGFWERSESIVDVLDEILGSYNGWWFFDADDKLRTGFLRPPTGVADFDITEDMLSGDLIQVPDPAPGLSSIVATDRNWYPYSDDELVPVGASITASDRALLQADYRTRTTGTSVLAPEYAHAYGASMIGRCTPEAERKKSGFPTVFRGAFAGQQLANRLTGDYSLKRNFYQFSATLARADAIALRVDHTVRLTHQRYSLANGRNLRVLGVVRRRLSSKATIVAWG